MNNPDPYHEGEVFVQETAGERSIAVANRRIIGATVSKTAQNYITKQCFVILGAQVSGTVWCSIIVSDPGFMSCTPDGKFVTIALADASFNPQDPVIARAELNSQIGLLLIDFHTRRRLRINGTILAKDDVEIIVNVEESYPNCPKFIQRRIPVKRNSFTESFDYLTGTYLTEDILRLIGMSDTFFVASVYEFKGADASHRGGFPGFVKHIGKNMLRVPDYPGNSMFNTFGNVIKNSKVGLLFMDFESSKIIQLSGKASINFSGANDLETGGTNRYFDFECEYWQSCNLSSFYSWEFVDYSPYNP